MRDDNPLARPSTDCEATVIIDIHTHIVPEHFPPVGDRAAGGLWPSMDHQPDDGSGFAKANVVIQGRNFRTVLDRCWSVSRRVDELAGQGIDRQVLSPMPELMTYRLSPEDGLAISRYMNETIARMMDAQPERFYGLGCVPLQDVDLAAQELTNIQQLGLQGVEILSNIEGISPGDAQFLPFFKEVEALGLAVFVHAQHPTFSDRILGRGALENAVGFPIESALAAASFVSGGTLEACPSLRLCISHGGGTFTQLLPRVQRFWDNGGLQQQIPLPPTEYARRMYYDDILFNNQSLRYLIDTVGVTQVIVGSDYPFQFRVQTPQDEFDALGLSATEREQLSSANALRFLGLAD